MILSLKKRMTRPFRLYNDNDLREHCTLLEIVFVGQCEVFVCDFIYALFFFSLLGGEAHRSANGVSIH